MGEQARAFRSADRVVSDEDDQPSGVIAELNKRKEKQAADGSDETTASS
jgi:hypothetical protein